ncbi:MAG TPA: hypothetical protein VMH85_07250 [Terriglobales bacterium]|nr:hypothetical protein [Terriglobales bacterium]
MLFLFAMGLTASAQTWETLLNPPPVPEIVDPVYNYDLGPGGAASPMLLTDGSVIVQNQNLYFASGQVFKLTPDINGSYVNGTWSQLASMPYVSAAGAQAVLADGRVIMEGGEYSGYEEYFTLTNQGAIYDPVADAWTLVPPPPFFVDLYPPRALFAPNPIGDSASVVLPDGTFMLGDKMSRQAAVLNLKKLTWKEVGTSTKADLNDEEGWTLLPNGQVLTVDCYTDYNFGLVPTYPTNPTNSEIYNPKKAKWSSAGSTINTLTDPYLFETGPGVLRPDGTVFAVGSQGYTSIYNTNKQKWKAGPRFPISPDGAQYTAQDAPGALLPNGNVLVAVSGGPPPTIYDYSTPPVAFFEFDGKNLISTPTIPNASNLTSYNISLLVLPTGQVLETSNTNDIEIYTPASLKPDNSWRPIIVSAPSTVKAGHSYTLSGIRLNGMSQATMFGDELQNATNYPLVRITNLATKHVFYSRTHDHSTMAVASNDKASTHFDVPLDQESGPSKLEVVANGIASAPWIVNVK